MRRNILKLNKNKMIIILLSTFTVISIAISVWALFFRETATTVAPDYAPKATDSNANKIGDETQEKLKAQDGGGAVSMTYKKDVTISLSEQKVTLMFQNPSKSINNIVLELYVKMNDGTEQLLAQSDTLPPGYELQRLNMASDAIQLSEGVYEGKLNILYYNPDTGEKAIVNGNLDGIIITVKP